MPNEELNNIDELDGVLQDYLDGLLVEGYFETAAPMLKKVAPAQDAHLPRQSLPNNVLPLPRFAETKPVALTLPLPKLKPVEAAVVDLPTDTAETQHGLPENLLKESVVSESFVKAIAPNQGGWLENGRPAWAQDRFECLMFRVGGLSLAVPLVELGSIVLMTDELTPLFGQSDWYMGMLPTVTQRHLHIVDTAKMIMPERYRDEMRANYRYVISLADMDWGLAVDHVSTAMSILPSDVKWRTQRSKRPWLAGTLISQMCAVLDIQQLAALLSQVDKRR